MLSNLTDKQIYEMIKEVATGGPCEDAINVANYVMQDIIDGYREKCDSIDELKKLIEEDYGDTEYNREMAKEYEKIFGKKK